MVRFPRRLVTHAFFMEPHLFVPRLIGECGTWIRRCYSVDVADLRVLWMECGDVDRIVDKKIVDYLRGKVWVAYIYAG